MSAPHSNDREVLGKRLKRREFWGELFGWLVGVGLVIEYWEDIVKWLTTGQLPPLPLVGGLLVTIGVFGEVWFSRLQSKTTEEISERADSDVAFAKERAAKAELATAELTKSNLELQRMLAPRRFVMGAPMDRLSDFKPIEFSIDVIPEFEARRAAASLAHTLQVGAGWTFTGATLVQDAIDGIQFLFPIRFESTHVNWREVADAMVTWMNDVKVSPVATGVLSGHTVKFVIGLKPTSETSGGGISYSTEPHPKA